MTDEMHKLRGGIFLSPSPEVLALKAALAQAALELRSAAEVLGHARYKGTASIILRAAEVAEERSR